MSLATTDIRLILGALEKQYGSGCYHPVAVGQLQMRLSEMLKGPSTPHERVTDMKVDKFWMVHRIGGSGPGPDKEHSSEISASDEAERLALQHPGEVFAVLEAMRACRALEPILGWVTCEQPLDAGPAGG
jgi:hypothetical protein